MLLVAGIPFADVFASWLLFDTIHRNDYQPPVVPLASITITAHDHDGIAPRIQHKSYWHDDIDDGDGGQGATVSDGVTSASSASADIWSLPNGQVQFECPLSFAGLSVRNGEIVSDASSIIPLLDPKLLGSGGSGAVFSFSTRNKNNMSPMSPNLNKQTITFDTNARIAIKVSWKRSRTSVEKECKILHRLENVPHVVRCLGQPNAYPHEDGRVMIALSPIVTSDLAVDGITSSVDNLKSRTAKINAVKCIVVAMIGMLQSSVYTIDVQPLIDIESGNVVFIDFTEANLFPYSAITPMDESAIIGFCTEMLALIPDSMKEDAAEILRQELRNLDAMPLPLPEQVVHILERIWME